MSWYTVTRVCFVAAVAWAAALTRVFHPNVAVDALGGAVLGAIAVFIETRSGSPGMIMALLLLGSAREPLPAREE